MTRSMRVQLAGVGIGVAATVVLAVVHQPIPAAVAGLVTCGLVGGVVYNALDAWFERRDLARRAREVAARTPEETERLREQARREAAQRARRDG